jgi:hypothetical protein
MVLKHGKKKAQAPYLLEQDVQYTYITVLSFGTSLDVATKRIIAPGIKPRPFNSE